MDAFPVDRPWEIVFPGDLRRLLQSHFFPGDHDEHAACMLAGVHVSSNRVRLLVRECAFAEEGVDHVPGRYGYKMVRAEFIRPLIHKARDQRLIFLSAHNHLSDDSVDFSEDDFNAHERGYPALLDIARGMPVGALVFGQRAIAGDIWLPSGDRKAIDRGVILDGQRQIVRPRSLHGELAMLEIYDRQVRLFGPVAQALLQNAKVAIIGLGGIGSQLAELLARLGIGNFVLVDPERADLTNLPRLVGSNRRDVLLSEDRIARAPATLRPLLDRLRRRKVDLAARNIRRANPKARVETVFAPLESQSTAERLLNCDFMFLAADQMAARLAFNAIVHQYFIPGIQVGARVVSNAETDVVEDVFVVSRPVFPDRGCLWCNGLIDPTRLALDAADRAQARRQAYGTNTPAPSVVSLNALAAADAVNQFQFFMTGLAQDDASRDYHRHRPLRGQMIVEAPRRHPECSECSISPGSRYARANAVRLPVKAA